MFDTDKKVPSTIISITNYILVSLLAFICLYPFYYILIYSISDPNLVSRGIILKPAGFSLQTYKSIFRDRDIYSAIFISAMRTIIGTSITLVCCSIFSYFVTQKDLILRKVLYRIVVISMYVNAGLIPWYLTMKSYGLKDNFLLYVLPTAIVAFYVILIKTYIESLPSSLEEAAMIDGAGYFQIFIKIIFPICMPIVATVAVFAAVVQWNSWMDNFFLVNDNNLQTMQLILYRFLSEAKQLSAGAMQTDVLQNQVMTLSTQSIKMCITVITVLPILCVYPFMQRYFVKGIMMGAVKG